MDLIHFKKGLDLLSLYFPPSHIQVLPYLQDYAYQLISTLPDNPSCWGGAFEVQEQLLEAYESLYSKGHPLIGMVHMVRGKIGMYIQYPESQSLFEKGMYYSEKLYGPGGGGGGLGGGFIG